MIWNRWGAACAVVVVWKSCWCHRISVFIIIFGASYITALVKSPEATRPGHHHENVFYKWGLPSFIATIPLSIITVVINAIIKKVYVHMAAWETHHHISGQEEWCMVKMAFGQYVNIVFVQWYVVCAGTTSMSAARPPARTTSLAAACRHGSPAFALLYRWMYGFPWSEPETWYTTCVPNIISTVLVTAFSSTVVAAFLGARKAKKHEQHRLAHDEDNTYDQVCAGDRSACGKAAATLVCRRGVPRHQHLLCRLGCMGVCCSPG